MSSSNYETIGSDLFHDLATINDPEFFEAASRFLRHYQQIPLFIVGLDDDGLSDINNQLNQEQGLDFKLPYPSILLDFPQAINFIERDRAILPIIYVADCGDNQYYVDVILNSRRWNEVIMNENNPDHDYHRANTVNPLASFYFMTPRRADGSIAVVPNTYPLEDDECSKYAIKLTDDQIVRINPFFGCKSCPKQDLPCKAAVQIAEKYAELVYDVISYINLPSAYIVRESIELTDKEKRLREKAVKPFLIKKPLNIVLDHSQVREIIKYSHDNNGQGTPKMPHERIGHWRQLRAERFIQKKKVWVRSTEINTGMKWEVGRRTYEIIR